MKPGKNQRAKEKNQKRQTGSTKRQQKQAQNNRDAEPGTAADTSHDSETPASDRHPHPVASYGLGWPRREPPGLTHDTKLRLTCDFQVAP